MMVLSAAHELGFVSIDAATNEAALAVLAAAIGARRALAALAPIDPVHDTMFCATFVLVCFFVVAAAYEVAEAVPVFTRALTANGILAPLNAVDDFRPPTALVDVGIGSVATAHKVAFARRVFAAQT